MASRLYLGVLIKWLRSNVHPQLFAFTRVQLIFLSLDHLFTSSILSGRELTTSFGITSETEVSFANFHRLLVGNFVKHRSFIIARNSQGPICVPCGIPAGSSRKFECTEFILTL